MKAKSKVKERLSDDEGEIEESAGPKVV